MNDFLRMSGKVKVDQTIEGFGVEVAESLLLEWSLDILIWRIVVAVHIMRAEIKLISNWLGFVKESVITQNIIFYLIYIYKSVK